MRESASLCTYDPQVAFSLFFPPMCLSARILLPRAMLEVLNYGVVGEGH